MSELAAPGKTEMDSEQRPVMGQVDHSQSNLGRVVRSAGGAARPSRSAWLQFLGWCLVALFLVTTFAVIEIREPTWEDELYVQSTAWSIVHGGPPSMSVDGLFPHNIPLVRFFGLVSFSAATALIKTFGLQTLPWRAVCFLFGISLIVVSSAFLLHLAGVSRWFVLAGAFVSAVSSAYCSFLPGRWDPVTVGLILCGMVLVLHAAEAPWRRVVWQAIAAGIVFGLALGSTPRALPPLAAVGCGVLAGAYADPGRRVRLLSAGIVAAFSSLAAHTMLLAPMGMTPWSWFQLVRKASKGDPVDCSPLLGGEWNFGLANHKTVTILIVLLLVAGLVSAWAQRRSRGNRPGTWNVTLAVMGLANFALTLLLISRLPVYAIFWLPLLIVFSFCSIDWDCLHGAGLRSLIVSLVCLELVLPATLEARRMAAAIELWKSRDPQVLLTEIRQYIPAGSIVFGPVGGYFFPVEQSGSRYLYLDDDITPGLVAGAQYSATYLQRSLDAAACMAPAFVVWPRNDVHSPLPDEIAQHQKIQLKAGETGVREKPVIYRLETPKNCNSVEFDANLIKPFGPP